MNADMHQNTGEADESTRRINLLREAFSHSYDDVLSSEEVLNLIRQHLGCPYASRLPVLVVTAAYRTATKAVGSQLNWLFAPDVTDQQAGTDTHVELHAAGKGHAVSICEVKPAAVTRDDIDRAATRITGHDPPIQNYLFVTTKPTEPAVHDYAASVYDRLGVEIAVLDCLGFLRHFLHFFHRDRMAFLESYQELLLAEPESAVRQALKEAFLTLRLAAETGDES